MLINWLHRVISASKWQQWKFSSKSYFNGTLHLKPNYPWKIVLTEKVSHFKRTTCIFVGASTKIMTVHHSKDNLILTINQGLTQNVLFWLWWQTTVNISYEEDRLSVKTDRTWFSDAGRRGPNWYDWFYLWV